MASATDFRLRQNAAEVVASGAHSPSSVVAATSSGGGGGGGPGAGTVTQVTGATGTINVVPTIPGSSSYLVALAPGITVNAFLFSNRFFAENYPSLQAAFNAACAAHGVLMLPPGQTPLPAGGLVVPGGFSGAVSIIGCGKNVSILVQANAGAGVNLVFSSQPQAAFPTLRDFSVMATNAACTSAVVVNFGTGGVPNASNSVGVVENVHVAESGAGLWTTQGFYFRNCWAFNCRGLSQKGTYTSAGGGGFLTGYGIVVDSCVNMTFSDCTIESVSRGVFLPAGSGAVGGAQGTLFTNLSVTLATNCLYAVLATNQWIKVCGFSFDDGNLPIASMLPIYVSGPGGATSGGTGFSNGSVLASQGTYAMELSNQTRVMVQNVDFALALISAASVHLSNATSNCSVQACSPCYTGANLILADAGTAGSKAFNNITGSSFTDNGSNTLTS